MGTFDGPGLRLVVFLQGCPFRCLYCANPDTIDVKGGTPTTPEEILQMAISQKAFFGKKGGITFSGGEPTLQAEALIPLFKELKANGIHICLDSNGGIWNEKVEELFSLTDLGDTLVTASTSNLTEAQKALTNGCGLTYDEYKTAYQKMLKSVYTYGGFWIGRYEAGIEGTTTETTNARTRGKKVASRNTNQKKTSQEIREEMLKKLENSKLK